MVDMAGITGVSCLAVAAHPVCHSETIRQILSSSLQVSHAAAATIYYITSPMSCSQVRPLLGELLFCVFFSTVILYMYLCFARDYHASTKALYWLMYTVPYACEGCDWSYHRDVIITNGAKP